MRIKLVKAGRNSIRLESIYVKTPAGLEIEIDCNWIILSRDGIQVSIFKRFFHIK